MRIVSEHGTGRFQRENDGKVKELCELLNIQQLISEINRNPNMHELYKKNMKKQGELK